MKLIKTKEIVLKPLDVESQGEKMMTLGGESEVECHVWTDIDGNPCAWTPVDSGVLSIEVSNGEGEDVALEVYRELRKERTEKTPEERIAELEAMVAKLATSLV